MLQDDSIPVMLLGAVGKDDYGTKIISLLEKGKVEPLFEVFEDLASSRCGVGIYKKERCLMPEIRASTKLSEAFMDSQLVSKLYRRRFAKRLTFVSLRAISLRRIQA